jgi:hypothetical protein
MKSRPLAITLFSVLLLAVGLSVPLQAAYLENFENIFRSMTVLNAIMAGLCVLTAISVYTVHNSFKYLLPLTFGTVVFNNWWVGYVGFDFSTMETTAASFAFAGICCSLLERNAFTVLRNPKLKWWTVAARKKLNIPVTLKKMRGKALDIRAFDISESGMFLQDVGKDEFRNYEVGERIEIDLHFNEILKVRCEAKIVRKTHRQGMYPAGIGLQ